MDILHNACKHSRPRAEQPLEHQLRYCSHADPRPGACCDDAAGAIPPAHAPAPGGAAGDAASPQLKRTCRSFNDLGMNTLPVTQYDSFRQAKEEVVLRIEAAGDRSVKVRVWSLHGQAAGVAPAPDAVGAEDPQYA